MPKLAIFYGSTTCYTEMVAEKLLALLSADPRFSRFEMSQHNIKHTPLTAMAEFDVLLLGISTWDFGELQEDWEAKWQDIGDVNLDGKVVAIFGLGDQLGYSDWFVDAVGMLDHAISHNQLQRIGYWSTEGYDFTASKATTDDGQWFVGLALDEANQYEQTDQRISDWCDQIADELSAIGV